MLNISCPQAAGRIWVWFDSLKRTFSSKAGRDRVNEDSRWLCAGCKGKFYTTHRMATWYSAVQFFPWANPMACIIEIATLSRCFICIRLRLPINLHIARHAPGRKFRKIETTIHRKKMAYRKVFEMQKQRSVEVVREWATEPMVVEIRMKWHERIHAQLTGWINEPMNR